MSDAQPASTVDRRAESSTPRTARASSPRSTVKVGDRKIGEVRPLRARGCIWIGYDADGDPDAMGYGATPDEAEASVIAAENKRRKGGIE